MRNQTDVGISGALPPALAFSVLAMLRLLTRLAVMSARLARSGEVSSVSMFCIDDDGWFRPALYTGSVLVRAE